MVLKNTSYVLMSIMDILKIKYPEMSMLLLLSNNQYELHIRVIDIDGELNKYLKFEKDLLVMIDLLEEDKDSVQCMYSDDYIYDAHVLGGINIEYRV
jgi:hypothetical protein